MLFYYHPPLPPSLLESWGWAVENFQNLEGKGLIWKIFRNKELARDFGLIFRIWEDY